MKISVVHKWRADDDHEKLAGMCADLAQALQDHPAFANPILPDAAVTVVLGGPAECTHWGVDTDALGFHAVISDYKADEHAEIPEDGEDPPGWYEIADAFEVHVNIEAGCRLLKASDDTSPKNNLYGFLVTVPHELLHLRDWIIETNGKTPLEVFDAGRGELSIAETMAAIEGRYAQQDDECEDAIERSALDITSAMLEGRLSDMAANFSWADTPAQPGP